MRLRKRVVFGLVAIAMVGASMPEARAGRVSTPAAVAAAPPTHPRITIMSFNACGGACRHGEVARTSAQIAALALRRHASVVLLQELCHSQYERIRGRLAEYGYTGRFAASTRSKACGTGFGVAALVRGPISESVTLPLPTPPGFERRNLLGVTARVGGRSTFVGVVHLSPSPAAGLDHQLALVARYLNRRAGQPVIVGGDFNSLPDKPGLGGLYSAAVGGTGGFVEADELRGGRAARGGAPTFDRAGRKIDYVFLSEGRFGPTRANSTETALSDHRVYVAVTRVAD